MQTLGRHGKLHWFSSGPKNQGPYYIEWGADRLSHNIQVLAKFGTKTKPGSQRQLAAYYVSHAAWKILNQVPSDIFNDYGLASRTVSQAQKAAEAGLRDFRRASDSFSEDLLFQFAKYRFAEAVNRAPHRSPSRSVAPDPEIHGNLKWREAASGRLDSFGNHGSYHIQGSANGFDLRWIYMGTGAYLGTFTSQAKAKQAAEIHNSQPAQQQAGGSRRRRRR